MLLSNALLVDIRDKMLDFFFATCKQNLSSQFFYLGIENPLSGGTLAKFRSPLYTCWYSGPLGIQVFF
jgi:hypothetical protein